MRYVYAREREEVQASSERAAESDPEGRHVAPVELSRVRRDGDREQVRDLGHVASTPARMEFPAGPMLI